MQFNVEQAMNVGQVLQHERPDAEARRLENGLSGMAGIVPFNSIPRFTQFSTGHRQATYVLGLRMKNDPPQRAFHRPIAVEKPANCPPVA